MERAFMEALKNNLGITVVSQIPKELEIQCYGGEQKTTVIMEGICLGIWFRIWGKKEL